MNINKQKNQAGFTLVELSIVLVIIGLIVSGVLAGQALIAQAKVRGQLRQIEEIKTSIGAFQTKYSFLPGDLPNPTRFFSTIAATTTPDGDGFIEGVVQTAGTEANVAFQSLFLAGLIQDTAPNAANVIPAKVRKSSGLLLNSGSTTTANYLIFGTTPTYVAASNSYTGVDALTGTSGLSGSESYALDSKIDDAKPHTGTFFVTSATTASGVVSTPMSATVANCAVVGTAPAPTDYYVDEANTTANASAIIPGCIIATKIGF
ncbi:MAG: type II secretion system protein [Alphaproteobacteria bacterium]|jgi:prepilin-type N-terminal cleavage/methylation domain-containing protein